MPICKSGNIAKEENEDANGLSSVQRESYPSGKNRHHT